MSINRRIVVTAVQTMELREEPIPAPAPGEQHPHWGVRVGHACLPRPSPVHPYPLHAWS